MILASSQGNEHFEPENHIIYCCQKGTEPEIILHSFMLSIHFWQGCFYITPKRGLKISSGFISSAKFWGLHQLQAVQLSVRKPLDFKVLTPRYLGEVSLRIWRNHTLIQINIKLAVDWKVEARGFCTSWKKYWGHANQIHLMARPCHFHFGCRGWSTSQQTSHKQML